MVNVNISEESWKIVRGHAEPGESFATTLNRVLLDWKVRGDRIGELDEELYQLKIRKLGDQKEEKA